MPFDGNPTNFTASPEALQALSPAAKLLYLAKFMEGLRPEQIDMQHVHSDCNTAHCAWGWGEEIGMISLAPERYGQYSPSSYCSESDSAESKCSIIFELNKRQFIHAFGPGHQFGQDSEGNSNPYTPADVARHLREVAAELGHD